MNWLPDCHRYNHERSPTNRTASDIFQHRLEQESIDKQLTRFPHLKNTERKLFTTRMSSQRSAKSTTVVVMNEHFVSSATQRRKSPAPVNPDISMSAKTLMLSVKV